MKSSSVVKHLFQRVTSRSPASAEKPPAKQLTNQDPDRVTFSDSETTFTTANGPARYLESSSLKERSHVLLLAGGLQDCLTTAARVSHGVWLVSLGGAGGVGLMANSVVRAANASNLPEQLEAASDAGWGAQAGLPPLAGLAGIGKWVSEAVAWVGVAGGAIQAGLGGYETARGIKEKDLEKGLLGGANTLAGLCWIAASMGVATAVTAPVFIALTVGAKTYKNRHAIKAVAAKGLAKIKSVTKKAQAKLESGRVRGHGVGDAPLSEFYSDGWRFAGGGPGAFGKSPPCRNK